MASVTAPRRIEIAIAAALALVAVIASPWGIEVLTGRPALSIRVTAILLAIDIFLLILAFAIVAQGTARKVALHLMAWMFPLVLLASLEAAAIATRLSSRIMPLEDNSVLRNWSRWPAYLLSEGRWAPRRSGELRLYRPWTGAGVAINELGLRTAPPTPKQPGEWRIAITGGSAVWGWRVLDADTIPMLLQDALRQKGANVTVYNFGIEGATLGAELGLLRRFRDTYEIDQVIFYTGGNDTVQSWMHWQDAPTGLHQLISHTNGFELVKTARRLFASAAQPATLRDDAAPPETLRAAIRDADAYCTQAALRCDFVLQPLIFSCKACGGALAPNIARIYPGIGDAARRAYDNALRDGPAGRVQDFSGVFDGVTQPLFMDLIHLNEDGNRLVAERLATAVRYGNP
jgi:lysophospholipase L1-like esterase